MDQDPQNPLRTADTGVTPLGGAPAQPLQPAIGVNVNAELVADVIAATNLVPADKLALVRGRAAQGRTFPQALVDEGVASAEGIARMLAARHQLPLVDLAFSGVNPDAARTVPLHVLERILALPYALENGVLRVAVADPQNIHGIDELRLATKHQLELGVGSREEILKHIRRLARESEAFGARAAVDEELEI